LAQPVLHITGDFEEETGAMKKILLASFAFAALAVGPAIAADMPVKAPPVKRAYSWTACYVGIHAGWGFGDVSVDNGANVLGRVVGTPASENVHPKGPEFGGTIGCDWAMGNSLVIGILGDAAWMPKDDDKVEINAVPFRIRIKEEWLATARARIGINTGSWGLWYLTGGAAFTDIELSNFNPINPLSITAETKSRVGWVAGWGAEYLLSENLSLKTETLYMDFGRKTYLSAANLVSGAEFWTRQTQWVSKVGLNYRFGSGAVVAKY
jgi:opacity protein-like surface antigen